MDRERTLVAVVAVAASLALASVHWLGLLVGGIAVGVLASTWPRALAAGLGFGALAWVVFLGTLWRADRLAAYWDAGLLLYASVGIPLALGVVGALAHGLRSHGSTA
ncbi:hypothetical protein [Halobacterium jilantaiense]|uniref:Uncharacterized protein n=1 Tax=Halobacterium jilantaiense TaxID=355548 RepID=A0A1I0NC78_9EURY|nr:hypothetical protein [Halobacterium jilantaiense]SEV98811.1 hypothetical protein SAMN04487945_0760 [Halobacterium jilantaiense]